MCLQNISKLHVATEDIICYKRLKKNLNFSQENLEKLKHNSSFTGIINDVHCEGKISICDGSVFFCTNNSKLNGITSPNSLGYNFSWVHDSHVQEIVTDGITLKADVSYTTPYQDFHIKIGESYKSDLVSHDTSVYEGFHSYKNKEDAINDKDSFEVIVECTIPKGAKYYCGEFSNSPNYASDTLIVKSLVTK